MLRNKRPPPTTPEERLDRILEYLENFDRRQRRQEKLSMIGGFIRLIPIAITVFSFWYFYQNADEIMNKIVSQAAQKSAEAMGSSTTIITETIDASELIEKLKGVIPN